MTEGSVGIELGARTAMFWWRSLWRTSRPSSSINSFKFTGAKLRLGGAREREDLLHDLVQMLDFFAEDCGVLRARVAVGNLQIERVIQHLHHRERIADFVRDLGGEQTERGKFFVLAQLFLDIHDALVEPRLFDGERGKFRQRGENADFLVGKFVGLPGVNVQRADGFARENQRHAQQRHQPFAPRHLGVLIAAGSLDVLDLDRFAPAHDDAHAGFPRRSARGFLQIRLRPRRSWRAVRAIRAISSSISSEHIFACIIRQASRVMTCSASSRFSAELMVWPTRASVSNKPRLEAQLFVEPGVVDDLGGGKRERLEQFLVGGGEGVPAVGIHVQHAADVAVHHQRHGEFRADILPEPDVTRIAA